MWHVLLSHTPLLYMTQSFWRDEAFSVLSAEHSLGFIVAKLGFEPPVYYTLLHYWLKIFGENDIAIRSLSFLGFGLATWIIIEWMAEMYKKHWLSYYAPALFFFNPMLLYYAFEVRTYAWYTFFATAMLYAYVHKKWKWFVVAAILGFYTHVYLLLFIGALGIHWLVTKKPNFLELKHIIQKDPIFRSFAVICISFVPWLIKVALEWHMLRSSWYFPVNIQLVFSLLGNMFTGYEGTPWFGWQYTRYLSLVLLACAAVALTDKKNRPRTLLFILFTAIPLASIVGISFIKPLFVNRYLIPATVGEVLVLTAAIAAIRNPWVQKITAAVVMAGVLWINWWYPSQHPKVPIRETIYQINALMKPTDAIYADSSLDYLESYYYAKDRSRVFLYDPQHVAFPWYVGGALFDPKRIVDTYPTLPSRAFIVHTDATFDIAYEEPIARPPIR